MTAKLFAAAALCACAAPVAAQCLPSELNGAGTAAVVEINAAGAAVGWWCPDRFSPQLSLYALRWESLTPALHAELTNLLRAPDKPAEMERIRVRYANTPLVNPALAEVWWPARGRLLASKPAAPAWVAADGAGFRLAEGGRLVPDALRVPAGTACECGLMGGRLVVEQTVYCRIADQHFAACVPRP